MVLKDFSWLIISVISKFTLQLVHSILRDSPWYYLKGLDFWRHTFFAPQVSHCTNYPVVLFFTPLPLFFWLHLWKWRIFEFLYFLSYIASTDLFLICCLSEICRNNVIIVQLSVCWSDVDSTHITLSLLAARVRSLLC